MNGIPAWQGSPVSHLHVHPNPSCQVHQSCTLEHSHVGGGVPHAHASGFGVQVPLASPTYHDLHITTAKIPRTSIFNLPYGVQVQCNRVAGWELWDMNETVWHGSLPPTKGVLIAGEYADPEQWLVLDVVGHVIVDSRR